jgi:hypothetical protein
MIAHLFLHERTPNAQVGQHGNEENQPKQRGGPGKEELLRLGLCADHRFTCRVTAAATPTSQFFAKSLS